MKYEEPNMTIFMNDVNILTISNVENETDGDTVTYPFRNMGINE